MSTLCMEGQSMSVLVQIGVFESTFIQGSASGTGFPGSRSPGPGNLGPGPGLGLI